MEAVRRSQGELVSVTKGYFVEPTSSAAFAGASKRIAAGKIRVGEKTLIVISGNGLKAGDKIIQYLNC